MIDANNLEKSQCGIRVRYFQLYLICIQLI